MPRRSSPSVSLRAVTPAAILLLIAGLVAACAGTGFDPSGPCTTDGRASGAYPELESMVSTTFRGRPPDRLDSGRNCTPGALATLVAHGVDELRFAGATWDLGSSSGVTLAVFQAAGLDPAWMAEFYETGARAGKNVESVDVSPIALPDGTTGSRIDALNGESYQSVLVWPDGGVVRVALIGSFVREVTTKDAHNAVVTEAIQASER